MSDYRALLESLPRCTVTDLGRAEQERYSADAMVVTVNYGILPISLIVEPPTDNVTFEPKVFVKGEVALSERPHVMQNGRLCLVASHEGTRVDSRDVTSLTKFYLKRAYRILSPTCDKQSLYDEFLRELEVYWLELRRRTHTIFWGLDPEQRDNKIPVYATEDVAENNTDFLAAACQDSTLQLLGLQTSIRVGFILQLAVDDALGFAKSFVPSVRSDEATTLETLRKCLCPKHIKLLNQHLKSRNCRFLAMRLDSGSGQQILGAFLTDDNRIEPVRITSVSEKALRTRGGSQVLRHTIVVVGCGAVGGHLVPELVRAGFSDFVLVDPDRFGVENTYRHTLGGISNRGRNKARVLAEFCQERWPDASFDVREEPIQKAFDAKDVPSPETIFVASAGDPSVHTWLTHRIAGDAKAALVLGWIEPFGFGGHVMLTQPSIVKGCYNCLFNFPEHWGNALSFVAPGQRFTQHQAGCGQLYTPYGSLDGMEVAMKMARLTVEFSLGEVSPTVVRSWLTRFPRGEAAQLKRSKYRKQIGLGESEELDGGDIYPPLRCESCGARQ